MYSYENWIYDLSTVLYRTREMYEYMYENLE